MWSSLGYENCSYSEGTQRSSLQQGRGCVSHWLPCPGAAPGAAEDSCSFLGSRGCCALQGGSRMLRASSSLVLMVLCSWEGFKTHQPLAQLGAELTTRSWEGSDQIHPWEHTDVPGGSCCFPLPLGHCYLRSGAAPAPRACPRAWTGTGGDSAASSGSQRSWRWSPSCSSPHAPIPAELPWLPRDCGWALPSPRLPGQSPPRWGSGCGRVGKVSSSCCCHLEEFGNGGTVGFYQMGAKALAQ